MNYTAKARELRRNLTKAEAKLWEEVRNRKTGLKIVRQKPIIFNYSGNTHAFYADFYCHEKNLVIEIDGKIHEDQKEYDTFRNYMMNNLGLKVIRIKNEEIMKNIDAVVNKIKNI